MREYTLAELTAQPIGYWSGEAYRTVVGRIRADLAVERLNQPAWWILNHVEKAPGEWTRARLTERLAPFDDQGTDFDGVYDDLLNRGWLVEESGVLTLTEAGRSGRSRAQERARRTHERTHDGVSPEEYAVALNVLRRMIENLGGDSDLP
ncbi:MarR family transcriptional regulator [Streptosporangium sp. NPDC048047]|uniref:MarR family transcriptional regulator n=1 Tax=Streptosporangium sp. NPDC048047 TaxID=3155748 RepID=UPI003427B3CC